MNRDYLLKQAERMYIEEYGGSISEEGDQFIKHDRVFVERLIDMFLEGNKIKNWKEIIENGN